MVSEVIKTEANYIANFTEVNKEVDEAYFLSYDSLSTINSFIYVISALTVSIIAFAFFYYNNRLDNTISISDTLFSWPFILISVICLIFALLILSSWFNKNVNLFTRALPFTFILLVIGFVIIWYTNKNVKSDKWNIPQPSLIEGDKNISISIYILAGIVSVGFITTWINSYMRVDRLKLLGPAYWSFVLFSFGLSIGSVYVVGFFNRLIKENDNFFIDEPWVYFLMAIGLFIVILVFDGMSVKLANLVTGSNSRVTPVAATPELANATYRSKQMITLSLAIVILVPVFLSMLFKNSLSLNTESEKVNDGYILSGSLILLFPVLTLVGLFTLQLRKVANVIYSSISNIMIAVGFVITALMFIPFNFETVTALGIILVGITLQYLLGYEIGSKLITSIIIGFIFMLVKFTGKTILESIGNDATDSERLLFLGLPMIVFTGFWLLRNYIYNVSYESPLTLFIFTLGYIWLYYDTASATKSDYILKDKDSWSSFGVDWVIVTGIIMLIITINTFESKEVDYFQYLSGRKFSLIGKIIKIVLAITTGFLGSLLYNKFLTDNTLLNWISSLQDFANKNVDLISKDLKLKEQ